MESPDERRKPKVDRSWPPASQTPSGRRLVAPASGGADEARRRVLPWFLAVAIIPIAGFILSPKDDVQGRIKITLEGHAEEIAKAREAGQGPKSRAQLFEIIGADRIEGAFLAHSTWTHWLFALVAAGGFWGLLLALYPKGNASSLQMWGIGLLVGTAGILFLVLLQVAAAVSASATLRGGTGTAFLIVLKFIAYSYRAATDPESGLILSMLGFTFGVGLLEELCKATPLIVRQRSAALLDLHGSVLWGLSAGIGFGVSEAIMYSSDFYNGLSRGDIYIVRFISCVALHAVWSGTFAILLWQRRTEQARGTGAGFAELPATLLLLAPSILLHGLYDTLLKKEMAVGALLTAAISFGLFFWLYDRGQAAGRRRRATSDELSG